MTSPIPIKDQFFTPFERLTDGYRLPKKFTLISDGGEPHPVCLLAAESLQLHLKNQKDWSHNFGLGDSNEEGAIIGKMFGVLIVETQSNDIGYLAAFSGKLAGGNHHAKFVPPVFDSLTDQSFVNVGMKELSQMNAAIQRLENDKLYTFEDQLNTLKTARRKHSIALQNKIFDHYYFLNRRGDEKSLTTIFHNASYKKPPSGAGECAGPKLLQYAFQHNMKPRALAEFWWGQSPKSPYWKHGHFYACCKEKCEPILAHMLAGINNDSN